MRRNHNKRRERKRGYDPIANKYELTARELANLTLGSAANAELGAANAARVHKLAASGRSARDIVLITGLSRATVYRALRRLESEPRDELADESKAQAALNDWRAIQERRTAAAAQRVTQLARIHTLAAAGYGARDIVLITGLSQAAVYRAMPRVDGNPGNELVDPLLL